MKKIFTVLVLLLMVSSHSFANDNMLGDCESIEMECIGTSLWCEPSEAI